MKLSIKRMCIIGLFTAISLCLFVVENALPSIPMFPYIKLGIANIVTLFVLFLGRHGAVADCVIILALRIVLGALITGQLMTVIFSGTGGLLALLAMLLGRKIFDGKFIPIVSVMGAVAHNLGQMLIAVLVYGAFSVVYYIPFLILGGITSGIITGFAVSFVYKLHPQFISQLKS